MPHDKHRKQKLTESLDKARCANTNLPRQIYILRKNYYSPESTLSSVLSLLLLPSHRQIVSLVQVNFSRICSGTRVQELQSPFCVTTHARLASYWIQYGGSETKAEALKKILKKPRKRSGIFKVFLLTSIQHPTSPTKNRLHHQNERRQGLAKKARKKFFVPWKMSVVGMWPPS